MLTRMNNIDSMGHIVDRCLKDLSRRDLAIVHVCRFPLYTNRTVAGGGDLPGSGGDLQGLGATEKAGFWLVNLARKNHDGGECSPPSFCSAI